MSKTNMSLSIYDLGQFLQLSPQTIRNRLRDTGFLKQSNKVGNRYLISIADAHKFIVLTTLSSIMTL